MFIQFSLHWTVFAVKVALRWLIQRGVAVIPKSNSPSHQRENISVRDS